MNPGTWQDTLFKGARHQNYGQQISIKKILTLGVKFCEDEQNSTSVLVNSTGISIDSFMHLLVLRITL